MANLKIDTCILKAKKKSSNIAINCFTINAQLIFIIVLYSCITSFKNTLTMFSNTVFPKLQTYFQDEYNHILKNIKNIKTYNNINIIYIIS